MKHKSPSAFTGDTLIKSEARLRAVLDNSSDVIYSIDLQTNRYEYVSNASGKVLGYTPDEFMAIDIETTHKMIHPDDLPAFKASLAEIEKASAIELHYRQRRKNGDYIWISNRLTVIRDETGRMRYRNGNIHDITEQVKNDEIIRYQANLLQNISDMVVSVDENFAIKSWNRAAELTYGWTEEEAVGRNVDELLQTTVYTSTLDEDKSRLLEAGKIDVEHIHTCKNGRKIYVNSKVQVIRDASGKYVGTVGIIQDITERKKMENTLREREMHLRLAAESASLGTYTFDIITGKVFWSDELKALWGLGPGDPVELDEDTQYISLHPEDKLAFLNKVRAAIDPRSDGVFAEDYRAVHPDGSIRWLHVKGQTTFSDDNGNRRPLFAAGVVIDITERVAVENSIRKISDELRSIIESTDDYIYSVDRNFRLVSYNSAFSTYIERVFGIQISQGTFMPDVLSMLDFSVWEGIFSRTAVEGKIQLEIKTDAGARVLALSFNPVFKDSEVVEITVFGKDITDRVNSEREIIRLNASLEKRVMERTGELAQSVSALQNLSRIVSNDLKAPIKQIETYTDLIGENADIAPYILNIRKTCSSMTQMIESLTIFAQSSDKKINKESVNIKKVIMSVYNELKPTAVNGSILQFESGLPQIFADKTLLRHALHNLLSYSLKFASTKKFAEITVGCKEENGHYLFYIRDNGVGYDMHGTQNQFQVFDRLHNRAEFEGAGMGMATVHNIIQRHGGKIRIESAKDVGTVVYFTLPI